MRFPDYDYLTEKCRGASYSYYNKLNYKKPIFLQAYIHNLVCYGVHLIIKELGYD